MNKNKDTKEKICAFYASDYHFEMISLPYINKKIEENNEVVILTENNLEGTMKNLLKNINLKEEKKEKIWEIDWKNNDLEKLETIKTKIDEKKDIVVFVKGNEKYIRKVNQNMQEWIPEEKQIKIIDCYNLEEVGENLKGVMAGYHKILKTFGEKEIEKL